MKWGVLTVSWVWMMACTSSSSLTATDASTGSPAECTVPGGFYRITEVKPLSGDCPEDVIETTRGSWLNKWISFGSSQPCGIIQSSEFTYDTCKHSTYVVTGTATGVTGKLSISWTCPAITCSQAFEMQFDCQSDQCALKK